MYTERKMLSADGKYFVDVYIQEETPEIPLSHKRPMVVVLPGGGYMATSDREAEPIALEYLAQGFNSAVVRYPIREDAAWPNPQAAASEALKYIRENAARFLTDPEKIAVCGFSAGGHLAATLGVLWDDPDVQAQSGCFNGENRPDALVLGYPVINGRRIFHDMGSMGVLLRNYTDPEEFERMFDYVSCDRHVRKGITPPTFIFSTWKDSVVPISNSLDFAQALNREGIPAEIHIFMNGEHGLALSDFRTYIVPPNLDREAVQWIRLSCNWLWTLFGRPV